jgi:hypothetical protein
VGKSTNQGGVVLNNTLVWRRHSHTVLLTILNTVPVVGMLNMVEVPSMELVQSMEFVEVPSMELVQSMAQLVQASGPFLRTKAQPLHWKVLSYSAGSFDGLACYFLLPFCIDGSLLACYFLLRFVPQKYSTNILSMYVISTLKLSLNR